MGSSGFQLCEEEMSVIIFRGLGIYGPDSVDRGEDGKEVFTDVYLSVYKQV